MTCTEQDHALTWVEGFQRLVVLCVENRTFVADNGFASESRRLAAQLSGQHLRAKDVARLHRDALAELVDGEGAERAHALLDAGEETLIAVLGSMADTYLVAQQRPTHSGRSHRGGGRPRRPLAGRPRSEHAELRLHLVVAGHTARAPGSSSGC